MNEAWTLLKGNPSMRDAEDRPINHPAAMVYDNLASQMERRHPDPDSHPTMGQMDDESVADEMERMRKPTHMMRIRRDLERGGNPTFGNLRIAQQRDEENKKRLNAMRQDARDETSNTMSEGSPDAGPNYGVERQQM